jgi:hypothetical protein
MKKSKTNFPIRFKQRKKSLKKLLILAILFTSTLQAQLTKSIDITSYYDDNLFRSPQPVTDFLTDFSVGLNYTPEKSDMNYYYGGSWLIYQDNTLRNFSTHNLGFDYSTLFGKENSHNFYMGADFTLRINSEEYNYYDYNQLLAYSNVRYDLDGIFIKAGYNFRYRSYSNLPDLTNTRHFIFVQANKSFDTRTTVIVEADLGSKSFGGQELFSGSVGSRGMGRMSSSHTSSSAIQTPSLNQAVILTRVTQSLHDKVGIYAQYRKQISLTNETSFINADGYFQDEELFDDPFSYESEGYSSQLTWVMPWSMKLKIGGALLSKNYISEQAFTSADDTLGLGGIRLDDRTNYYVKFTKTINLKRDWVKSLRFNLDYSYIRNESNSYWYDYENALIGGGLQWNF